MLDDEAINEIYDRLPKFGLEQDPYYSRTAIRIIGSAVLEYMGSLPEPPQEDAPE